MRRLIIAGCRGSGLKALEVVEAAGHWDSICFVDDDTEVQGTFFEGRRVWGLKDLREDMEYEAVCPIGNPANRLRMIERLQSLENVTFPNVAHPSACVSNRAILGVGNLFSQGVVVQAGAKIGDFNTFNVHAVMGPMAKVWSYCTINSHTMIASEAVIGSYSYIGMGAMIKQRINVAEETTVGANAFVNKEFEEGCTLVGIPAWRITT